MTNEALSPPTDADREVRDIEWVRRSQKMYVDGFRVRQATAPPEREQPGGGGRRRANPRESMADLAEHRCPNKLPAHERERWIAGFLDADRIAVEKGHAYLGTKNPERPARKAKPAPVAEPIEAFPDFVLKTRTPLGRNERGLLSPGGMAPAKNYTTADEQWLPPILRFGFAIFCASTRT